MDWACPLRINLALGFVQDGDFAECKGGRDGDSALSAKGKGINFNE